MVPLPVPGRIKPPLDPGGAGRQTAVMSLVPLRDWFVANHAGLLVGAIMGAIVAAVLLLVRWLGQRACERDPEHYTWRSIIGRVFARTALLFIIVAAADAFATYANLPRQIERLINIAFIVAFGLQGADAFDLGVVAAVYGFRVVKRGFHSGGGHVRPARRTWSAWACGSL